MLLLLDPCGVMGTGPNDPGPPGAADTAPDKLPPRKAPAGAYPPPPRKGYAPGGGGAA